MAGISDYIMMKLLNEKREVQKPERAPEEIQNEQVSPEGPPGPAGPVIMPAQGSQLDPRIDFVAKKFATIGGSPAEKYEVFIQLIPQLLDAFSQPPQASPGPEPGAGYDVKTGGLKVTMPQ